MSGLSDPSGVSDPSPSETVWEIVRDEPLYRARTDHFEASFVLGPGDDPETATDIDVDVLLIVREPGIRNLLQLLVDLAEAGTLTEEMRRVED